MKATSKMKANGIIIHNLKHAQQFLQIQTARWRAYQILAKILRRKRAAIQVVFLRTMVVKATQTVIIIRNTQHQQVFHPSIKMSRLVATMYTSFKR